MGITIEIQAKKMIGSGLTILTGFLLALLTACSEPDDVSADKAAIVFKLGWPGKSKTTLTRALSDCGTVGVSTIEVELFDDNDGLIKTGGPWDCSARTGQISSNLAGRGRRIAVKAKEANSRKNFFHHNVRMDDQTSHHAMVEHPQSYRPLNINCRNKPLPNYNPLLSLGDQTDQPT